MRPKTKKSAGFQFDIVYSRARPRSLAPVCFLVLFTIGAALGALDASRLAPALPTYLDRSSLLLDLEEFPSNELSVASAPQSTSQSLILPGTRLAAEGQVQTASRSTVLSWPLIGTITSAFGWRVHPITGVLHYHEGLDIAAATGTQIRASASGTVTWAAWSSGYGRLAVVTHGNGLETRYAHLSRFAVAKGQQVLAGEVVGYVGESGDATGPHCHFEVRQDGKAKNPKDYLP